MATATRTPPAPPEISELSDFDESINILIFADHGVGKTVLAGSLDENCLIIATENGTISAKRMGSKALVTRVADWTALDRVRVWIKAQLRKSGEPWFEYKGRKITWIAIDTASEMQDLCIREILDSNNRANPSRDLDIPAVQDYGKWQNAFKRFVKSFNDMPINVLWLAAEMSQENDEGDMVYRPSFNGRLGTTDPAAMSKWVCGAVQAYGRLTVRMDRETRTEYRRLIMKPPVGKDRYNITRGRGYIDRPNMPDIWARITGEPESAPPAEAPASAPRRRRTASASTTTESE